MVESNEEELVREERRQEAISTAVPTLIFTRRRTKGSMFHGFEFLPPSARKQISTGYIHMVIAQNAFPDERLRPI
jgi:hypothetical protein